MRAVTRPLLPALALLAAVSATALHAQSPTPEDHPGFRLAEAIAAQGCVLHQDDVSALLDANDLMPTDFPQMALPLIQDGILASTGNGTLTLVNWGLCTGLPAPEAAAAEGETATEIEVESE
jgi:hypothetical protein